MRAVSWFAGIGGFDIALRRAGHEIVGACEIDRFARRVYAARLGAPTWFPEDIRDVEAASIPEADLWCGGFPCFAAGTLILTKMGYVPIEQVRAGDFAYTHEGRWRPVTSIVSRQAPETLKMKGSLHYGLTATAEHPFWSSDGRKRKSKPRKERRRGNWHDLSFGAPSWTHASEMEGRYWATPILSGTDSPPAIPKSGTSTGRAVTVEMMWFLGAWLGDGWVRKRKDRPSANCGLVICAPRNESKFLEERLAEAGLKSTLRHERTVDKFHICQQALGLWTVEHFGEYCDGKKVPGWLFGCDKKYRRAFVEGYVWADGSNAEWGWRAATINRTLAVGVCTLAHSLGYTCSMYRHEMPKTCIIEGRVCSQSDQYALHARYFRKQTGAFRIGDKVFSKCKSVVKTGGARVFNISVAEDESYIAEGVVVHNCQDLSIAGLRRGIQGERSGLVWRLLALARERKPAYILLENVPGLLSGADGDLDGDAVGESAGGPLSWFGALLGGLAESGYVDGAWRVLDARWFAPQRRARIFILARRAGAGGRHPAEVLLEREGVRRDPPARGEAREDVAGCLEARAGRGGYGTSADEAAAGHVIAFDRAQITSGENRSACRAGDPSPTLQAEAPLLASLPSVGVRRATATECEKLMGFPDGWTCTCGCAPYSTRACRCPDGPRYRALGNAVCVDVVEWIARRLG